MKYTLLALLLLTTGCTNCYNHINSDNRAGVSGASEVKTIVPPIKTPIAVLPSPAPTEWVLTSTTRQYVGSYIVIQ